MKAQDWVVIVAVAFVTMAVGIGSRKLTPQALADAGPSLKALPIVEAKLEHGSASLQLELDKNAYSPGDKPVVLLTAANAEDSAEPLRVTVSMKTTRVASPFSRMLPAPKEVWNKKCTVSFSDCEPQTIKLPTDTALTAGTMVTFTLAAGDEVVSTPSFSVQANANPAANSTVLTLETQVQ